MKKLLTFCLIFFSLQASELEKFYEKYRLPEDKVSTFYTDSDMIFFSKYYERFKLLPEFFIKDEKIGRLINAERMRRVIENNNLIYLDVPQKYIYKSLNKIKILADTIEASDLGHLSLQEVKAIVTFIEKTGYHDWHSANILRNIKTNKLTLIDTENNAFVKNKEELGCFYREDSDGIFFLFENYMLPAMQENALSWFKTYLIERKVEDVLSNFKPLPVNQEHDDAIGIDFEVVKAEY